MAAVNTEGLEEPMMCEERVERRSLAEVISKPWKDMGQII